MAVLLAEALRETIRVQGGRIPLLERHLARLAAGGCDDVTLRAARQEAERTASRWREPYGRMSLVVSRDGTPSAEVSGRPSVIDVPGGPTIAFVVVDGVRLPPGAAKPADHSQWDEAHARAGGADLAVLLSAEGEVLDTSHATLWVRRGRDLLTPPSPPALAGVSRGVVFDIADAHGLRPAEARLTRIDMDAAEELMVSTAVAGVRPVRGRGGAASDALAEAFERLFAARP